MAIIARTFEELADEATRLNELLQGKTVQIVYRHKPGELVLSFEDGTSLYVDNRTDGLEFSVTA